MECGTSYISHITLSSFQILKLELPSYEKKHFINQGYGLISSIRQFVGSQNVKQDFNVLAEFF